MNNINIETGNNTASIDGENMKKSFLKKIKSMLQTQKNEIEKRIENNIKNGDLDGSGDDTDLVQARILHLAAKQIAERDHNNLKKIEGAVKRIEAGNYGICGVCEEDIGEARLLINPAFVSCISCSEKAEITKRRGY